MARHVKDADGNPDIRLTPNGNPLHAGMNAISGTQSPNWEDTNGGSGKIVVSKDASDDEIRAAVDQQRDDAAFNAAKKK